MYIPNRILGVRHVYPGTAWIDDIMVKSVKVTNNEVEVTFTDTNRRTLFYVLGKNCFLTEKEAKKFLEKYRFIDEIYFVNKSGVHNCIVGNPLEAASMDEVSHILLDEVSSPARVLISSKILKEGGVSDLFLTIGKECFFKKHHAIERYNSIA